MEAAMPDDAHAADPAAALRKALLGQLDYLTDEIEALKQIVRKVPEPLQEASPLDGMLSIKEMYGLLAALDEHVHLPRLHRLVAEDAPSFDLVDEAALARQQAWNDQPVEAILARVQAARRPLVAFLEALPPEDWHRTASVDGAPQDVYRLAHTITQHDADVLREIGQRLHESHLTERQQDLPK